MLLSFNGFRRYSINATDGELGTVKDVYLSDDSWLVRYMVVDTGQWLTGRQMLLSAAVLQQPVMTNPTLHVDLTKEQAEKSPEIAADKPVSRQNEEALAQYYRWPQYWAVRMAHGPQAALEAAQVTDLAERAQADPCLRSASEVSGYRVNAAYGEIGHVEDFIVDTAEWNIRYLVINTRNWWPGKKVLLSPHWLKRIDWVERSVQTELPGEAIKSSPPYNPQELIDRNYEEVLHNALGQPKYWSS